MHCIHQTINVFAVGEVTYCFKELLEFLVSGAEWSSKFHCSNFDAQSSAIFFGSSRSLMRPLSSPSVILWLEEPVLGKCSASLEADGCCSSLFEEKRSSSSEYITKLSGSSGTVSPSPWGTGRIDYGTFGYTSVDFFFMDIQYWIGGTIQK